MRWQTRHSSDKIVAKQFERRALQGYNSFLDLVGCKGTSCKRIWALGIVLAKEANTAKGW